MFTEDENLSDGIYIETIVHIFPEFFFLVTTSHPFGYFVAKLP